MENIIWRGIAVLLTAYPIALIGHRMELDDMALIKGFTTIEEFRAFCSLRVSGTLMTGFLAVVVFGFVYLVLNDAVAAALRFGYRKIRKNDTQPPNQPSDRTR